MGPLNFILRLGVSTSAVVLHNDNDVHEAVRSLLEASAWFDSPVTCSLESSAQIRIDSEVHRAAHIQTRESDSMRDGDDLREYRDGSFVLSLFAREESDP